jgi:transmembrane sensor
LLQLGAHARTLVLDHGEAYFEVAHAPDLPFAIRSGAATVQVLGTTFLVRHAAGDAPVHVAVEQGKVHVTTPTQPGTRAADVTLTAGQVGDITDSTSSVNFTDDSASGTEWAPGRIMFHRTPVATILRTVSRWYGYHFHYTEKTLGAQSVTMIISTRSSAEALAALERVLGVNLNVVGDTITLVPQPPRASRSVPRIRTYDVWTPTREAGR